jgi:hypothetical protein
VVTKDPVTPEAALDAREGSGMAGLSLVAVGRPDVPPLSITERLRSQLVYFMSAEGGPGIPSLGEREYWIAQDEVAKWLDDGVFYLISPLDSANQTEVELSAEQEDMLQWLQKHRVPHVRVVE